MKRPDHQMFAVGDFIIYSNWYDGDIFQLVREGGEPGTGKTAKIHAEDFEKVIARLFADEAIHIVVERTEEGVPIGYHHRCREETP